MKNVEVLSLSFNKITTLRDIKGCLKLKELYIRKNDIKDLKEIKHLSKCSQLRVLWFSENPCSKHKDYRYYIIKHLPYLTKLDNEGITQSERNCAEKMKFSSIDQEDNDVLKRSKNDFFIPKPRKTEKYINKRNSLRE